MTVEGVARQALHHWGFDTAKLSLVAQRENMVFRVKADDGMLYALRLHRPGYQSDRMIMSELTWMAHLRTTDLNVPRPFATPSGALLVEVGGYHTSLLSWLSGVPMGTTGAPLTLQDRQGTFRKIGGLMAQLHLVSDAWQPPDVFERQRWDIDGLLGETPLWNRFWENPALGPAERIQMQAARDKLRDDLQAHATDFGLIHADMLRENVMIEGDALGLIDFDDSGYGYRLFDVATTLLKNRSEPDYADLQTAFLSGYRDVRPLDTSLLPQFMLIRALSYLGWIIPRMDEPGADTRQARFLATSLRMVSEYLNKP